MARSFYKGPRLGNTEPCLLCRGLGEGRREVLHLTRGVKVWLCEAHRDPAFLRSRAGRDFAVSLVRMWSAAGCLTARRAAAVEDHMTRVRSAALARDLPGSYAWPELRREAEDRFARGHAPRQVIGELRRRHEGGHVRVPSRRTMQRWFSEGRWLARETRGRVPA